MFMQNWRCRSWCQGFCFMQLSWIFRSMRVVGASSLAISIGELDRKQRVETLRRLVTPIRGLSFNPTVKNKYKQLQYLLSAGCLAGMQIIVWHDVINNSLTRHPSNGGHACTPSELLEIIGDFRANIRGIVYYQRAGAPKIYHALVNLGKDCDIAVIDAKKLMSSKKRRTSHVLEDLSRVHPSATLELRLLRTVLGHCDHLAAPLQTKRGKKKNSFPRKRKQASHWNQR